MKLKLLSAIIGLTLSSVAFADSYKAEVNGSANWIKYDEKTNLGDHVFKGTSYNIDGKYYFNPVKTDNGPLAEAAFLGKNSNVFAYTGQAFMQYDYPSYYGNYYSYSDRTTVYGGGLELYVPENFLYLKVDGRHTKTSDESSVWGYEEYSDEYSDNYTVTTLGVTPIDGLLLTTTWETLEAYRANISAKYVTSIGNGQFINLEASATRHGEKNIGGDFYFDKTFSVGAAFIDVTSEDNGFFSDGHKGYELRARKFFTESLSAGVSLAHYENAEDTANLNVSFRF